MQMLDEALTELVRKGQVRPEDAMAVANDPAALRTTLGRF